MSDSTPSSHPSTTAQIPAAHTASQQNSLIYDLLTQGTNHGAAAQQQRYRSVFCVRGLELSSSMCVRVQVYA